MAQIHALTPEGRLPSAAIEHVQELAGDALGTIPERTAPIQDSDGEGFAITDQEGRVAFSVESGGAVKIGGTSYEEDRPGYRVMDRDGRVAFEVTEDGRTHAYDLATGGGGDDPTGPVETLHVFVAAGQSNMQGRGFPVEGPESPRIMQYGANRRVLEQAPLQLDHVPGVAAGTGPATFFAHHYLATQPAHVGVLIVPGAYGGTKFTGSVDAPAPEGTYTWTAGAAFSPEYDLYARSVTQTLDAITAAEAAGYHVIVKGVLWHQGEGNGGLPTDTYAGLLDNLISDYRTDLGHPTLPFMVGQMCPEGMEDQPAKYTVDAAHQDTPYRTAFTGFAPSTRDGHNVGDTTHFSTVGTSHLGDTYLTAYIEALGNVHQHIPEGGGGGDELTTGWIDLTPEITKTVTSGRVRVKRTGPRVTIVFEELVTDGTGNWSLPRLNSAYWPQFRVMENWFISNAATPPVGVINISPTGYFNIYNTDPANAIVARVEYETDRPFPA